MFIVISGSNQTRLQIIQWLEFYMKQVQIFKFGGIEKQRRWSEREDAQAGLWL